VGVPVVKTMSRFLNTSLVVDPDTETVISVMWNR